MGEKKRSKSSIEARAGEGCRSQVGEEWSGVIHLHAEVGQLDDAEGEVGSSANERVERSFRDDRHRQRDRSLNQPS